VKRAFTFRLARVARVRKVFEDEAQAAFSAALLELRNIESRCDSLRRELDHGHESLAQSQTHGRLDISALLARERSLLVLGQELTQARAAAARASAHVEHQRSIWQAKRSDRQALDELAKRHKLRHIQDINRAENAESDEVATQRFSHPRG